jgi:glycosyltransferase involved in cell wall biosynthesis
MKNLSILIPTYNDVCCQLVNDLQSQAAALGIDYEIIVADDGSTDEAVLRQNRTINALPCCRLLERGMNSGRAVIRNVLASEARYPWLLFIDSDMTVCRTDFIERYVSTVGDVVYGGLVIRHTTRQNLRARYELSWASEHTLERRRQSPYHDFHTANFMIRRDLMLTHPFDERFSRYGYEDVLLGKTLQMNAIGIEHIDNPLSFEIFESNAAFVSKTEEGLQTLYSFRHELRGYSRMIDFTEQHPVVSVLIRCWHHIAKKWERRHLCSNAPTLCVFTLYRLGYFLSLKR